MNPRSTSAETVEGYYTFGNTGHDLTHVQAPQRLSKAIARLATPFELCRDCRRLVHIWQPPFKLRSDSSSLVDI